MSTLYRKADLPRPAKVTGAMPLGPKHFCCRNSAGARLGHDNYEHHTNPICCQAQPFPLHYNKQIAKLLSFEW
ncbi:hypothetical protein ACE6H2_011528 [Prunus campanulata]